MLRNAMLIFLHPDAGGSLGTAFGQKQARMRPPRRARLDICASCPTLRAERRGRRIGMNSALDGLRVLDFTTTIAGPHCTRLLADLGAEVIKIEAPEGDMMRTRPPLRNGASTSFGQLNAGKKSIALDLKTPHAIEAVRRLVATCDVVVENFRPGVMRRFGLDY